MAATADQPAEQDERGVDLAAAGSTAARPRARPTANTTTPDHGRDEPEQDPGVAEGPVHRSGPAVPVRQPTEPSSLGPVGRGHPARVGGDVVGRVLHQDLVGDEDRPAEMADGHHRDVRLEELRAGCPCCAPGRRSTPRSPRSRPRSGSLDRPGHDHPLEVEGLPAEAGLLARRPGRRAGRSRAADPSPFTSRKANAPASTSPTTD